VTHDETPHRDAAAPEPAPPHKAEGADAAPAARTRGQRLGRRIVALAFLSFVVAWVIGATGPIVKVVLYPDATPPPWASCREGQLALHDALTRAVLAAQGDDDADEALRRFRDALAPEWGELEGTRVLCRAVESERRSLDALERLRYAEEHAVRREASSLAALRRQVASSLGRSPGERLTHPDPLPTAPTLPSVPSAGGAPPDAAPRGTAAPEPPTPP
jgi:hypothetical protein